MNRYEIKKNPKNKVETCLQKRKEDNVLKG